MIRILIVEQDRVRSAGLSNFFLKQEVGFEVGAAGDAVEALDVLTQADPLPHLVLLNIELPNMNGWSLRDSLRRHSVYQKIPIILFSVEAASAQPDSGLGLEDTFDYDSLMPIVQALGKH